MWQSTFPPRGKQELQVNFPVLRGKWHEVPKGEASAAEAKGGFERSEKTDEESYLKTRRPIHR